ncbi:COR domain-containing protein [Marinifilum flexuosum]|uniref:COR domain-containing protein n=1 Tax=Marinifilum flexuosum TaxID=1117708 RepID=UPI002493D5B4|nr:COR domain-containing protein [Marinifilum flexuosum]
MEINYQIAHERIDIARQKRASHLNLSGLGLTSLDVDISDMTYLDSLDLSFNKLSELPDSVTKLYNLITLNVSYNYLQDLIFDEYKVYAINEIDISNNHFFNIPQSLLRFEDSTWEPKSISIYFYNNPFLDLIPTEIANHYSLSYCQFYIDSLDIESEPNRLFETKLLIVGKGNVGKTTLVKTLKQTDYKFKLGAEEATDGINIDCLNLGIYFPATKPYYSKLTDFNDLYLLNEDKIVNTTNGIYPQEDSYYYPESEIEYETNDYYYDDYDGDYRNYLKLVNAPYHEVEEYLVKKEIKVNLWDFGGQEILYSTHQFFLTQRSLYLFVWEPRTDNEEESFEYWLTIIQRLSNNCPVIIVMNKADIRIKNIDENNYKKLFKNIVGFIHVSCFTKEGIDDLKALIKLQISQLPHLGDTLPSTWENIRANLNSLNEDFISYDEFKKICNFSEVEKISHMSGYLNDLGDIIHFKDDIILRNLVIINPHWLTKAIYKLIHSLKVQRNNGILDANDLEEYLDSNAYPKEKHFEILSLMEKFEICFKIIGSGNMYVIPTLLQAQSPIKDIHEQFISPEALNYQIQYNFLPSGLIERLICRINNYIENNIFWKYGAIFNTETGRAFVELNKIRKIITVRVIGEVKSYLYSIISHELKQIHSDLKLQMEDYAELYACNCMECTTSDQPHMFDKNVLTKYIRKSRNFIDCQNSIESVNIEELMIGYKSSIPTKTSLLRDIISAASQLQTRIDLLKNFNENQINTYYQDLLRTLIIPKRMFLNEQSLKGKSESGKSQGELDIAIESKNGNTISLFEGFILTNLNKTKISRHIQKSILNYDTNGLKEKFVGIYARADDFDSLSQRYSQYITNEGATHFNFNETVDITKVYSSGSEIKVLRSSYFRSETKLYLFHLLINLNL